jgi:ribosomal protein L37AE/L43A
MTRKLSKAEAGKLGFLASKEKQQKNKKKRINAYYDNPTKCKNCAAPLIYEKRRNIFCSHKCAGKFNNGSKKPQKWHCKFCKSKHTGRAKKYCNITCFQNHRYEKNIHNWIIEGIIPKSNWVPSYARRYLIEVYGEKCSICGIRDWQNKPLSFDIDHINGDPLDHSHTNLRLLCKNCHSQTPTYGGKNKGSGRKFRYSS